MATVIPAIIRKKIFNPLKLILLDSRAVGIILLCCTVVSLIISNTTGGSAYIEFWHTEIHFFSIARLPHSLLHFINDALMPVFFFLAGMEIKREMTRGELSSMKKSALPVTAAIGGMIVPAVIYSLFNKGTAYGSGWGIPTATDIAFSLGIASLLGNKVPVSLRIFLTALAIVDDLGAIVVIALFYGGSIQPVYLTLCGIIVILLFLFTNAKIKFGWLQILLGIALWYCMFNSGIHATVSGVIFAFFIPQNLLSRYETQLHHTVYFFILPVFALANTAIIIPGNGLAQLGSSLSLGIMVALFIGKPFGIFTACRLLVNRKLGELPTGVSWQQLTGAGILAGIGFTMSIFIATLAFNDLQIQDNAKIAVLAGSFAAMLLGYIWFAVSKPTRISQEHKNKESS